MACWITVYCRASVASLSAEQLLAGITDKDPSASAGVDYQTLAESYDLDDSLALVALERLAITPLGESPLDVSLTYEPGARPIVVHWTDAAERIRVELEEARELRRPPPWALERFSSVREIVMIELGFSQLESMGIVFAFELARYLAQKGDGFIVDDDKRWREIVDGAFEERTA